MRWWTGLLGLAQAPGLVVGWLTEVEESQWREWAKVKHSAVFQVPGTVTNFFSG